MKTTFENWTKEHGGVRCASVQTEYDIRSLCGRLRRLTDDDVIAVDTETDGLTHDRILVLLQVGVGDNVWLVKPDEADRVFSAILNSQATITAHNLAFDLLTLMIHDGSLSDQIAHVMKTSPYRFMCTMTLSKVLHGNAGWNRHGLNHVAKELGCYVYSDERMSVRALRTETFEHNTLFFQEPTDDHEFLWYSASDVIMLLDVHRQLTGQASEGQLTLATFETCFAFLAAVMCQKGMLLDMEKLDEFSDILQRESKKLLSELNQKYGCALKTWHDRKGLASAIRSLGGVFDEDREATEEGSLVAKQAIPKVNKKALQDIRHGDGCSPDLSRFITEYLRGKSTVSDATKIPGYKLLATPEHVLHADFKPLGTVTGRTSCNKPNLQNVRKRGELSPRKLFVPRPGYSLASCDYSGIEVRVLAWLAQDGVLAGHIRDGFDMHQSMADHIGADRFTAKCAVFGMLYGEGARSRSDNYGLSLEQSQAVADRFADTYRRAALWLDGAVGHARAQLEELDGSDGHIDIGTGWRCNVRKHKKSGWPAYIAANYHIQGWAAHFLKRAALRLFASDMWQYCVMSVHDEFIFEFPTDEAECMLRDVMKTATFSVDVAGEPFKFELDGEVFESFWGSEAAVSVV